MPKGEKSIRSADARRNSPRIAIRPSIVRKLQAIADNQSKSKADILEELIMETFAEEIFAKMVEINKNLNSSYSNWDYCKKEAIKQTKLEHEYEEESELIDGELHKLGEEHLVPGLY